MRQKSDRISGTITLDGTPLKSGVVRLIPFEPDAGPGTTELVTEGDFLFTEENGPVAAEHRVEIEATDHQAFAMDDEAAFTSYVKATGRSPFARNPIPAIYNTASQLTARIAEAEDQTFAFELSCSGYFSDVQNALRDEETAEGRLQALQTACHRRDSHLHKMRASRH